MARDEATPPAAGNKNIWRYETGLLKETNDSLAREEPMEIRLSAGPLHQRTVKSISVTMRTPGDDVALALGFLFTEGIIQQHAEVLDAAYCPDALQEENKHNVIRVSLHPDVAIDFTRLQRNFYTTSSCGVCGKESIEAIRSVCPSYPYSEMKIAASLITSLPDKLRQQQIIFGSTGGLHASAFFDAAGNLLALAEDVGRHNALDKLIGKCLFTERALNISPAACVLLLSGRASFELIQKAAMAGCNLVCAVGAPSSLAVELAVDSGITLIGFLRGERFNIYSEPARILSN